MNSRHDHKAVCHSLYAGGYLVQKHICVTCLLVLVWYPRSGDHSEWLMGQLSEASLTR